MMMLVISVKEMISLTVDNIVIAVMVLGLLEKRIFQLFQYPQP